MQMETEISVLVKTDFETLQKELKEEYVVNGIYMIDENVNISNMSYLDILKKCILVRDIAGYNSKTDFLSFFPKNGEVLEFDI